MNEQVLRLGRYDLRGMPPDYSRFYWPPSVPISDTIEGRRYTRRNRLKIPGKRGGRHLSETPVAKQVIAEFTKPLVDRLTGDNIDPPGGLADTLAALPPEDLAQAILTPLLHGIFTVWRDKRKPKKGKSSTARQKLSIAIGQYIHVLLVRHKLLTDGDVPDRQKLLASLSKKPRHRRKKDEPPGKRGRKRNRDARKADADSHYGNHAHIGRKRMAKTLASSLPIITLGIKRGCTALIATSRTISTSQVSNRMGQISCWIE